MPLQFAHPLNRSRLDGPARESICRTKKTMPEGLRFEGLRQRDDVDARDREIGTSQEATRVETVNRSCWGRQGSAGDSTSSVTATAEEDA